VQDPSSLFILAEIAVAFAGFSSIVAALGQRSTRDHPRLDAFRLRGLLEVSLLVVAFSLVPYAVSSFSPDELIAWRLASGLFFAVATWHAFALIARGRSLAGIRTPAGLRITIIALNLIPLALLVPAAGGIFGDRIPAIYLLCLLSYLLAGGIAFLRVMVSFIAAVPE
jgi:hypothetical protein